MFCALQGKEDKKQSYHAGMNDLSAISLAQGADASTFSNIRGLLQSVNPTGADKHVTTDSDEHSVVRYGTQCSLRSRVVSTQLDI